MGAVVSDPWVGSSLFEMVYIVKKRKVIGRG